MNRSPIALGLLTLAVTVVLSMASCTTGPAKPEISDARSRLSLLQADPQLAGHATAAILEAESAVRAADAQRRDSVEGRHLASIAGRKVDIAWALAQSRHLEAQRVTLGQERERARLNARTREANAARDDADVARNDAELARSDANVARSDAAIAQGAAIVARGDADAARADADRAREETDELQRLLAELGARSTERGMVVALGDVMFESGRSTLRTGSAKNLAKLAAYLAGNRDRTVYIEGHTDSVGSDSSNLALSRLRADAVREYLIAQGAEPARLSATGLGEGSPIGDNATAAGREQNRRVEVIIANPTVASR